LAENHERFWGLRFIGVHAKSEKKCFMGRNACYASWGVEPMFKKGRGMGRVSNTKMEAAAKKKNEDEFQIAFRGRTKTESLLEKERRKQQKFKSGTDKERIPRQRNEGLERHLVNTKKERWEKEVRGGKRGRWAKRAK